jgi:hypothetical protein
MSENLHLLLNNVSITSEATEIPIVLVDSEDKLVAAVQDLSTYDRMAFDAEGAQLSRNCELTIATIQGFPCERKKPPSMALMFT